jgi:uncharacterized cupin superfamily protein
MNQRRSGILGIGYQLACMATLLLGAVAVVAYATTTRPVQVARGKLSELNWVALPEFGGAEAILYRSPDGKRVAAAFRESGKATFTYPFDEFLYVTSGSVKVRVHGGETFELATGDVAYFLEGTTVDFDFSSDFSDVTMLVADHEVKWR